MAKFSIAPWLDMRDLKERMEQFMEETHGRDLRSYGRSDMPALWQPAADVYETACEYVLQVELPGFDADAVNVEVRDGEIWIYGERRFEKETGESVYQVLERSYGPFARRFHLPDSVEPDGVKAQFRNGLLTIVVPKRTKECEGRRIEIKMF